MNSKQLMLNDAKTECLIVVKNTDVRRLDVSTLCIDDNAINVNKAVKDSDVIIGCTLIQRTNQPGGENSRR